MYIVSFFSTFYVRLKTPMVNSTTMYAAVVCETLDLFWSYSYISCCHLILLRNFETQADTRNNYFFGSFPLFIVGRLLQSAIVVTVLQAFSFLFSYHACPSFAIHFTAFAFQESAKVLSSKLTLVLNFSFKAVPKLSSQFFTWIEIGRTRSAP